MVLGDRRDDRWLFAEIDSTGRHLAHGVHHVGVGTDTRQRFLDALEAADGHLELAANAGVGADCTGSHLGHAGIGRGQRNRTACGQALHQHAPALAGHLLATDDEIERHEDILAARRSVHEHGVQREQAAAGFDAGVIPWHQGTGDADVLLVTEQAIRVVHVEGEAENRAYGAERDVALVPSDAHADHFLALPHALADDADVGDRRGVGTGPRAGQCEGRDFETLGEARQIVVLLLLCTIVQQQFGRAERVRHHHRYRQRRRAGRQLGHHLRVGIGRELQTAVLLGDDHAKEALVLDVLPGLRRHVLQFVGDLPVIDEAAGLFDLVVHEGLLFRSQLWHRVGMQLVPVRLAAEQLAIPPHRTGLERVTLGVGHLRQDFLVG